MNEEKRNRITIIMLVVDILLTIFAFIPCLLMYIASFLAWLFCFILYYQSPYIGVAMGLTVAALVITFVITLIILIPVGIITCALFVIYCIANYKQE